VRDARRHVAVGNRQGIGGPSDEQRECIENCSGTTGASERCAGECTDHDADHCRVRADVLRECADGCPDVASG